MIYTKKRRKDEKLQYIMNDIDARLHLVLEIVGRGPCRHHGLTHRLRVSRRLWGPNTEQELREKRERAERVVPFVLEGHVLVCKLVLRSCRS